MKENNIGISFVLTTKTLRQILFTKFRSTDFRVISTSFVKGWQTLSRVIEFIWNTGWEACLQYSVTDKDYKYLQDMPDSFRSRKK